VIIFDDDLDIGQVLAHGRFQLGEAYRLEAHVSIVKVLNRWLDKNDSHWDCQALSCRLGIEYSTDCHPIFKR
jgi:hypothetical protein